MITAAKTKMAVKNGIRDDWDRAAAGWDRHGPEIRRWLRLPTQAMLEMAGIAAGQSVLDIAAGAGDQTLDIAALVGAMGKVAGTDISSRILTLARVNADRAGYGNVAFHVADAEDLRLDEALFDSAVCRLGLMFLPHPLTALIEVRRVLKPGCRFCAMVFAGPEVNPCIRILMATALRHAGLQPRDPFAPGGLLSLGRPGHLDALFHEAGFKQVASTRMDAPFHLPSTTDYLAFIRESAAPVTAILDPLDKAARDAAWQDIARQLDAYQTAAGWAGPNSLLLTVGQA